MNHSIKYKINYRYTLTEEYLHPTRIARYRIAQNDFIVLQTDGVLEIKEGYSWDGASGPAVDTTSIIRAALIHDALYQLIREGLLEKKHRKAADKILQQVSRQDGMSAIRAWWVYWAVRLFGGWHCR